MNSFIKYSILLAVISIAIVNSQKPGFCPPTSGFGICIQGCNTDNDCSGSSKCCSNGCGRVCREPLVINPYPKQVNNLCPPDNSIGLCVINPNSCWSDTMCKSNQRCCPKGCGRECVDVQ